ncbi:MAG: NAD-dependent epimerase/dehydratase family protein [Candidatus Sericytochromatia bacterium]
MKKILVTGVSGFIGGHIALYGLKNGYKVFGTVRNKNKEKEIKKTLKKYLTEEQIANLFILEADLMKPDKWDEVTKNIDGLFHVASPFVLGIPKDENDLIKPARLGVKHVFEAAIKNKVDRIIQTSSTVAIIHGHSKDKEVFDETSWTNLEGEKTISPYIKSKTLAEQDVWKYVKENSQLKVTTINPSFVLGPILGEDVGTSGEVILKLMKGKYPAVPKLGFPTVDVRDVAKLHYLAFENNVSINQRYIASSSSIWFKTMAEYILEAYPQLSSKIKAKELPNFFVKIFSLFDPSTKSIIPELGFKPELINKKAKDDFNFDFISVKDATIATAKSFIEQKIIQI